MTIILFLIDTSASMCQRAHVNGVQKTYLDIAKGAVETFLKYRQRSQDCMGDRYMLLTFEDPPNNVKAGWKENHATFMNELKNLQSNGLTTMGEALKNAFNLLNLNRMQSGIDTYGQGRCPFYLEPSVIIVITDGGKYSFPNGGVHPEINMTLNHQIPGTKFTKEPFRWDQRLFALVLRMSGNKGDERVEGKVPHDDYSIEKMCEVTGGRSYRVRTQYVLNQCIESLVQKVQPGVVINFESTIQKELKDGECQDLVFTSTKKMIYVQKHPAQKTFPLGFWPIPEAYWPDPKLINLPPRDAHPKIRIVIPCVDEPLYARNFPVDKYELEASPLTLQILSRKDTVKVWPVVVGNIANNAHYEMNRSDPFGYLKANVNSTIVHLFVLPYNYVVLMPLINDLLNKHNLNPPSDWIYKFSNYVKSIPQYYCPFLRRALGSLNIPYQLLQYILPENLDSYLSPTVANYLKQTKNLAKQDQDNLCLRVFKQLKQPKPAYHQVETTKLNSGQSLKRDLVSHPMLKETFAKLHCEINVFDNYTIVVPTIRHIQSTKNYRNPFDIPRSDLIDEISRMRDNFIKPISGIHLYTKDAGHSLPIAEMGNYQEFLKNKVSPLKELEPTNVRQHMFGNPYKKDKHMVMVDEADVSEMPPTLSKSPNMNKKPMPQNRKRKAGPIRKDFVFNRSKYDNQMSTSSLPQAPPNIFTDAEDETASESSSILDTDDERLTMDFDEPEEFPVNGVVQNFINGDLEDGDDVPMLPVPAYNNMPPTMMLGQMPYNNIFHHFTPIPQPPAYPPPPIQIPPINGNIAPSSQSVVVQPAPISISISPTTSTTSTTTSTPPLLSFMTNDMNDASEISKILQQSCTQNGSNGSSITGSSTSNTKESKSSKSKEKDKEKDKEKEEKESKKTSSSSSVNNNNVNNGNPTESNSDNLISSIIQDCNSEAIIEKDDKYHLHSNGTVNNLDSISIKVNSCNSNLTNNNTISNSNDLNSLEDPTLDEDELEMIREQNNAVRQAVFKDIRRPGRNYSSLFENLQTVKGNYATRFNFVQMCIGESLRFRRKHMANCIQEWWDKQSETVT